MIIDQIHSDQIHSLLQSKIKSIRAIYLFGSGASENYNDQSDIDLAILARSTIEVSLLWKLKEVLSNALQREVDLIDLSAANTVLVYEVISQGVRIYSSDTEASEIYEMRALTQYFTLNDDRREILANIEETGTIYG